MSVPSAVPAIVAVAATICGVLLAPRGPDGGAPVDEAASVLAEIRSAQLSDSLRVGLVPIVQRGATPEDVATKSGHGALEVTEHRNHQKAQVTSFRWDGTRLRLE